MAKHGQRKNGKGTTPPVSQIVRRNLRDHMDICDNVLTGLIDDTMETPKANSIISGTKQWGVHLNTAIRASRIPMSEHVKKIAALPE